MLREEADIGHALSGTTAVFYFGLAAWWLRLAVLARHLKLPTVGCASNYYSGHSCSEQVASLPALVAPKPLSSGLPCKLQSQQLQRTPQPVVFFMDTQEMSLVASGKSLPLAGFS